MASPFLKRSFKCLFSMRHGDCSVTAFSRPAFDRSFIRTSACNGSPIMVQRGRSWKKADRTVTRWQSCPSNVCCSERYQSSPQSSRMWSIPLIPGPAIAATTIPWRGNHGQVLSQTRHLRDSEAKESPVVEHGDTCATGHAGQTIPTHPHHCKKQGEVSLSTHHT